MNKTDQNSNILKEIQKLYTLETNILQQRNKRDRNISPVPSKEYCINYLESKWQERIVEGDCNTAYKFFNDSKSIKDTIFTITHVHNHYQQMNFDKNAHLSICSNLMYGKLDNCKMIAISKYNTKNKKFLMYCHKHSKNEKSRQKRLESTSLNIRILPNSNYNRRYTL